MTITVFISSDTMEIPAGSAEPVSYMSAVNLLREMPTELEYDGNFIGFINEADETVQFIRISRDNWLVDIPIVVKGKYDHSLRKEELTTEHVESIVAEFFKGKNIEQISKKFEID
ncbi:MAG: hypothetical protein EU544_04750 [Promethearchaeota archaeon]|nr:MAG: hypothetical protein EU544_04750 [Candidatus Lokiarchaeota archaeon]